MRFLLDVSALLSLGVLDHEFHHRTANWVKSLTRHGIPEFATCALTELGFLRVLAQVPQYGFGVSQARDLLLRLKKAKVWDFSFIADDQDVTCLPNWVKTPKQVTDGHLVELAKANGAVLATLDRRIPGAFLIPEI
jgi:predicted nucleic acid-binding protein